MIHSGQQLIAPKACVAKLWPFQCMNHCIYEHFGELHHQFNQLK